MKKAWSSPVLDELNIEFTAKNPTNNRYETDEWTTAEDGTQIAWNGTNSGPAVEAPLYN